MIARPSRRRAARGGIAGLLAGCLALCGLGGSPAAARDWLYVEGIVDGEVWLTDPESDRLSRNEGGPAPFAHLDLWAAAEATPRLSFFVLGDVEHGFAGDEETEVELEQGFVRWATGAPRPFSIEAGRLTNPTGSFGRRQFATINPLIGEPGGYEVTYPWAVLASGAAGRMDYRVAIQDLPAVVTPYVPEPGSAIRPLVGAGVTPLAGLRIAGTISAGPYLSADAEPFLPPGADWKGFGQQAASLEVQYSHGYLEMYGEVTFARYEVPTRDDETGGRAAYLETKYTWTPRLYTAIRLERNQLPYIKPMSAYYWAAGASGLDDLEVGIGLRTGAHTIVKASYRADRWDDEAIAYGYENGHAFAVQIAHRFDVTSWFRGPRGGR